MIDVILFIGSLLSLILTLAFIASTRTKTETKFTTTIEPIELNERQDHTDFMFRVITTAHSVKGDTLIKKMVVMDEHITIPVNIVQAREPIMHRRGHYRNVHIAGTGRARQRWFLTR